MGDSGDFPQPGTGHVGSSAQFVWDLSAGLSADRETVMYSVVFLQVNDILSSDTKHQDRAKIRSGLDVTAICCPNCFQVSLSCLALRDQAGRTPREFRMAKLPYEYVTYQTRMAAIAIPKGVSTFGRTFPVELPDVLVGNNINGAAAI